jgi:hypothetical protein
MTPLDVVLFIIVVFSVLLAVAVDAAVTIAWVRRRWR